jgi:hypothetical protein
MYYEIINLLVVLQGPRTSSFTVREHLALRMFVNKAMEKKPMSFVGSGLILDVDEWLFGTGRPSVSLPTLTRGHEIRGRRKRMKFRKNYK